MLPNFSLIYGMWIGKLPFFLPKLTIVEKTLIVRYCCHAILIKL
jgi:hypothetical protein